MIIEVKNENEMVSLGTNVGLLLGGGEVIELIGDVGSGKTTFVKGLALGLDIKDKIQSPSFTINRVYEGRENLILSHYDFYRLNDAGIMANELNESIDDPGVITILEWASIVSGVLPDDRLSFEIKSPTENSRIISVISNGPKSMKLMEQIKC